MVVTCTKSPASQGYSQDSNLGNLALSTFIPLWLVISCGSCRSQKPRKTGVRRVRLAVCGARTRCWESIGWSCMTFSIVFQPSTTYFQPPFSGHICSTALPDFQGPAIHHRVEFIYSLTPSEHCLPARRRPQWVLEIARITVLSTDKESGKPAWGGEP